MHLSIDKTQVCIFHGVVFLWLLSFRESPKRTGIKGNTNIRDKINNRNDTKSLKWHRKNAENIRNYVNENWIFTIIYFHFGFDLTNPLIKSVGIFTFFIIFFSLPNKFRSHNTAVVMSTPFQLHSMSRFMVRTPIRHAFFVLERWQ